MKQDKFYFFCAPYLASPFISVARHQYREGKMFLRCEDFRVSWDLKTSTILKLKIVAAHQACLENQSGFCETWNTSRLTL